MGGKMSKDTKCNHPAHGGNPPWRLGVLVEYQSWEKITTVLSDGTLHRVPARDVEKYGRGGLR